MGIHMNPQAHRLSNALRKAAAAARIRRPYSPQTMEWQQGLLDSSQSGEGFQTVPCWAKIRGAAEQPLNPLIQTSP